MAMSAFWGRSLLARLRTAADRCEQAYIDPLLDRALDALTGTAAPDPRQRPALAATWGRSALTAEERTLNRGLTIAASALGLAVAGARFWPPLRLLSLAGLLYNSRLIYRDAYRALVDDRTVGVDALSALINTAYLAGGLLAWGSVAQISFFFSERLLSATKDRFTQDATQAVILHSQIVWRQSGDEMLPVPLDTVQRGDILVVLAGELIPVNGTVQSGAALVDEQALTGAAGLVEKTCDSLVLALSLVVSGHLSICVDEASSEIDAVRVEQLLRETVDDRPETQLAAVRVTDRMVVPVLALSAVSLPWLGPMGAAALLSVHPQRQLLNLGALSNLSFARYAMHQQILVKDGRALEMLTRVDAIVFDKTGTLTQTQPEVAAIHVCGEWTAEALLTYASAAEQHQEHPIARALQAAAQARQLHLPVCEGVTYQAGMGLTAQIAGQTVQVGSVRHMEESGVAVPPALQPLAEGGVGTGNSLVLVAVAGRLMGAIELRFSARPEAGATVLALRRRTQLQKLALVSGDHAAATAALAESVGIDEYVAAVLPADKAALIAELQVAGCTVCYVGDGINDVPALQQADVSISLWGAAAAATETAQIVLLEQDLQLLGTLFDLAAEYAANQRQSTAVALTPGILGALGVFVLGFGLPQMTLLDLVDTTLGTGIALGPWLRRRLLAESTAPTAQAAPAVLPAD